MKLVEVKVLEPEQNKGLTPYRLDGLYDHPTRYRFVNCWIDCGQIRVVGGEGLFPIDLDGIGCETPFGRGQILGEIDKSRMMEADRFVEVR